MRLFEILKLAAPAVLLGCSPIDLSGNWNLEIATEITQGECSDQTFSRIITVRNTQNGYRLSDGILFSLNDAIDAGGETEQDYNVSCNRFDCQVSGQEGAALTTLEPTQETDGLGIIFNGFVNLEVTSSKDITGNGTSDVELYFISRIDNTASLDSSCFGIVDIEGTVE